MARRKVRTERDRDRARFQFHDQCLGLGHHFPFSSLQRFTRSSATCGLVNGLTSPPSMAIPFTSRELITYLRGSAMTKAASTPILIPCSITPLQHSTSNSPINPLPPKL